ncbi:hypothetical protein [Mesomycoplasma hyorhinis]|uniref:hypothetical protein n=1 Tax=Mesomycoplasma hyorhinis TaxID=2100 RepID=UPI001C0422C7|nr:hypothetical protein [Mesomycoplasma hyorhinis]UVT32259.1 hypothetical protein NV227_03600 [Mesomycoplasma hyorhinis]UVT32936.1 hypothetical protein NV228_03510 [Mesomycoplasma hyorhinis]UVT33612.1 hypothetical protein NV229_03500 [Mesomycoplasma hyorhinis]
MKTTLKTLATAVQLASAITSPHSQNNSQQLQQIQNVQKTSFKDDFEHLNQEKMKQNLQKYIDASNMNFLNTAWKFKEIFTDILNNKSARDIIKTRYRSIADFLSTSGAINSQDFGLVSYIISSGYVGSEYRESVLSSLISIYKKQGSEYEKKWFGELEKVRKEKDTTRNWSQYYTKLKNVVSQIPQGFNTFKEILLISEQTNEPLFGLSQYLLNHLDEHIRKFANNKLSEALVRLVVALFRNDWNTKPFLEVLGTSYKHTFITVTKALVGFNNGSKAPNVIWDIFNSLYNDSSTINPNSVRKVIDKTLLPFVNALIFRSVFVKEGFSESPFFDLLYNNRIKATSFVYVNRLIFTSDFRWDWTPIKDIIPTNVVLQYNSPYPIYNSLVKNNILWDYVDFRANDQFKFSYIASGDSPDRVRLTTKRNGKFANFSYTTTVEFRVAYETPGAFASIASQYRKVAGNWNSASDLLYYQYAQEQSELKEVIIEDEDNSIPLWIYNQNNKTEDDAFKSVKFSWNKVNGRLLKEVRDSFRRTNFWTISVPLKEGRAFGPVEIKGGRLDFDFGKLGLAKRFFNISGVTDQTQPKVFFKPLSNMSLRLLWSEVVHFFSFEVTVLFPKPIYDQSTKTWRRQFTKVFTLDYNSPILNTNKTFDVPDQFQYLDRTFN